MKHYLIVFLITFLSSNLVTANQIKQNQQSSEIRIKQDTSNLSKIELIIKGQPTTVKNESNDKPWVIALSIGILTALVTLIGTFVNRSVAISGINASAENAIKQINNAQEINLHQFNATLKTNNRQDWINELRTTMSEFMSNCSRINLEFQNPGENSKEKIKEIHEKITLNRTRLILMLDPKKPSHEELLNYMKDFVNLVDYHVLNYRGNINDYKNLEFIQKSTLMIENARELLYAEWQKIQKLTDEQNL
jgi:hypothetical protein